MESAPKYQLIYQHYVKKIESGELKDGERLPTEEELCLLFDASRATVRNALKELAYRGYIVKKHSKGSFVRSGEASMSLDSLQGFTDEMTRRGLKTSSKLLRADMESADPLVSAKLNIAELSKVFVVQRLRMVEEKPMAIETVHLPFFRCPDLLDHDLTGSLYSILEKEYGLRTQQAKQALEASLAVHGEAELLGIEPGAPVLRIDRTTYFADASPMEYCNSVYRGDKYKFYVTLNNLNK